MLTPTYELRPSMRYRRSDVAGATYFFTVNAADRQGALLVEQIDALRAAFRHVRNRHPFDIEAAVVLPDHLHLLMTLPSGVADFGTRIMLVKQAFSRAVPRTELLSPSRRIRGERGIWQRRYWEHRIRDEDDFARHVDYIHYNPVKHGWAARAGDWPHSSIHRYIRQGLLAPSWGEVRPVDSTSQSGEP